MWSFWSYAPETVPLRAAAAFALALVVSLLTGGRLIAFLKGHERGGQPIRGDGPKSHIEEKKGTPTMGGLLILGTSLLAMLLFANVRQHFVWISMLVLFIYGLTGFADDYVKVKKQTPNAMTAKMKLFIQFMAAVLAVNVIAAATPNSIESRLYLPYIDWSFQLSWVYIPFAVIVISGDGGMQMNIQEFATAVLEELPLILCVFNNEYLGMVRQWQKLFYGKRYSMTNLRSGALSRRTNGEEYPKYTPDFVKLAESYGAKGIRVFNKNEVAAAFEEAKKNTKVPTLIEFIIDPEEMVYPMVKPGGTLEDLIMDC